MSFESMSSQSLVDSPATVMAAIRPESLSVVDTRDISLWAITPYSASEPGILLLYHFDRNTDEASNRAGLSNTSGVSYAAGAFAEGIAGGSSFQLLPPAGSLSTNFSIEFWFKTDTAFVDRTLLSNTKFSLTTSGNGNVRFTSGTVTISGDIDKSSWHHVAIGRSNGSIMLFIDGVFAEEQPMSTAFTGAITVSCPSGFLMDELSVRSALQTATAISGKPSLILPQSEKATWSIPGQAPATPSAPLPSASWQGPPVGTLTFTVRSSEAVDLMISMRHLSTDPDLMWAKMAGPIRISGNLKPPVANPPGKGFTGSLLVTLTSADRATVRYTTDGSDPTESSPVYAGPLTLTHSQTIKARAFGTGYTPSSIMSELYIRQPIVTRAWYSDSDGDGKIDRAVMILDTLESGLPESFTFTDPFNAANTIKVTAAQTVLGAIPFLYTASLPVPFTLGTGFSPGLFGIIDKGDGFSRNPFMVADSVAPVVVTAAYRPGAITSGSRTSDTLVVEFSESVVMVKNGSIMPFKLKSGDLEYTFLVRVVDQSGSEVVFAVDSVIGEVRYPKNGDKISLHIGEVKDVAGSTQQSSNNREVPLSVTYPPVITEQKTAPNPFAPGVSALPTRITAILRNDPLLPEPLRNTKLGTVVILKSMTVLPAEILNLSAHATIYDQVGNAVRKDMQLSKDAENSLYLVWDGRNENGRYVGSGTYVAAINTSSIAGARVHRSKIGVKR